MNMQPGVLGTILKNTTNAIKCLDLIVLGVLMRGIFFFCCVGFNSDGFYEYIQEKIIYFVQNKIRTANNILRIPNQTFNV